MSSIDLDTLTRPFPKDQVRQRKGPKGRMLDYVETHAVISRLNEAFEGAWSFRIRSWWKEDEEVVVLAQLVGGGEAKTQFGSSALKRDSKTGSLVSIGDDLKAAASDALKKCATEFGVALELYGAPVPTLPAASTVPAKSLPIPAAPPPSSPMDRLFRAYDAILKLPGGAGIFSGVLDEHGAERIEDLSDDQVSEVVARCETVYRTSRGGKAAA